MPMSKRAPMNFWQILAALHPDHFQDAAERSKAKEELQKLRGILDGLEDPHGHEQDRNAKLPGANETDHLEDQKGPELCPYHQEAHNEATQYLYTLYFELVENPRVAFYNPTKFNQPTPGANEAIRKLDEINNRILTRNCFNDLNIAVGQIQWDRLIEKWKSILWASEDTTQFGAERKKRCMSALAAMCKDLHYPSEWANTPPGDLEEPYPGSEIDHQSDP